MERKILYLEIDEEITSVIDKLKKSAEDELHLVVPKEAALLQSVVNLKLLKIQAEKYKKTIHIITQDKVGRNLAEQVGLDSATGLKQISASEENQEEEASPKEKDEGSKEIIYKEKESPIEETKEVVFEKGTLVEEQELSAEAASGAPTEADRTETVLQFGLEEDPEKSSSSKKEKDKKDGIIPRFPYKKFSIIAVIILFLLGGFLYVYLPLTKIELRLAAKKETQKVNLVVDKSAQGVNVSGAIIPAVEVNAEKTITKNVQTTGTKNIGTKAQGTLTVSNSYSTSAQTLVAGTRFESGGLTFVAQSDISVPGYVDEGDGAIAGNATVSVIAAEPGDEYNLGTSTFHIPLYAGTARYDKLTAVNKDSMSGGTTKEVKIVTEADITAATEALKNEAETEIKKEGQNKKKEGFSIEADSEKVTVGDITVSKKAGDEANEFSVSAKAAYYGLSFNRSELNKMVYEYLKSKTIPTKQILETELSSVDLVIDEVNFEQGKIMGTASVAIHLGTKIDDNRLKDEVIGNNKEKAENYLKNLEGVESVKVDFWPGFYQNVTRLKNHIYIKTEFVES